MLAVSLSSVGFLQARALTLRRRELEQMRLLAEGIAGRIRLGRIEVSRILQELSREGSLGGWTFLTLFCECAEELDFRAAFARAVEQYGRTCPLPAEDLSRLGAFGEALGSGDLEEELRRCAAFEEALSRRIRETEETLAKKAPMYQTLWCCIGVLGGILLL